MSTRYERYNEITFEAYCKICIDHAVSKGKKEIAQRAKLEIAFSNLPDSIILSLAVNDPDIVERIEQKKPPTKFQVKEYEINVHDHRLGQALQYLNPKDRGIILLYHFLNMSDAEVGTIFDLSRSTIQRRRVAAQRKLKNYMRGIE